VLIFGRTCLAVSSPFPVGLALLLQTLKEDEHPGSLSAFCKYAELVRDVLSELAGFKEHRHVEFLERDESYQVAVAQTNAKPCAELNLRNVDPMGVGTCMAGRKGWRRHFEAFLRQIYAPSRRLRALRAFQMPNRSVHSMSGCFCSLRTAVAAPLWLWRWAPRSATQRQGRSQACRTSSTSWTSLALWWVLQHRISAWAWGITIMVEPQQWCSLTVDNAHRDCRHNLPSRSQELSTSQQPGPPLRSTVRLLMVIL
jgi:hypothetical protein